LKRALFSFDQDVVEVIVGYAGHNAGMPHGVVGSSLEEISPGFTFRLKSLALGESVIKRLGQFIVGGKVKVIENNEWFDRAFYLGALAASVDLYRFAFLIRCF